MSTFSRPVQELIHSYQAYLQTKEAPGDEPKIQVDEIASKIASFYEKFRNLIDYQESHLLRKNVIGRALRRRIFLKDISGEDIAEPLIKEIIRSGHLGNNTIPERKILEVQRIIDNLLFFLEYSHAFSARERDDFSDWLLGVTVCAIEETLVPPEKDRMLATAMFQSLHDHLRMRETNLKEEEKDVLLFIAVQKALFRVDNDQLCHRLLILMFPEWEEADTNSASLFAGKLLVAYRNISLYLKHPLLPSFLKLCNHYNIVFQILGGLVFGSKSFLNLEEEVRFLYGERYRKERGRLFRMAFLSVLSFFLSKILVAVAVEVPIDVYITNHFSLYHTLLNIALPPLLMLLIVASIRLPSRRNLYLVQHEVGSIVSGEKREYTVQTPKKRGWFIWFLVHFIYIVIFIATIRFISEFLLSLGFSISNVVVFLLFTSLVTAVGVKIYNRSKEMSLEKERPQFFNFLLDVFTMPLVTIGKWLISGFRRFNIFVIFVNVFVEFPFQLIVEFLENLHDFVRAKKEEIQ
ncbi:MAG: hypothetical protein Q8P01_03955 [bacterium]|nr:hypothetical protein [bacterium]